MIEMTSGCEKRKVAKCRKNSPISEEVSSGGDSCGENILKKGPWTSAEDEILRDYVEKNGEGNWNAVQKHSGLLRCGKSCRLRWANHLRPDLKKGPFSFKEESQIIKLHAKMGNKWARMAAEMPGRTDNEIKNFWNTRIKRLQRAGLPLYPPGVHMQHQQNDDMRSCESGDMHHSEASETNGIEIPEVKFNDLDIQNKYLKHSQELFDIACLQSGVSSSNSYGYMLSALNPNKRLREVESQFYGSVESTSNTFPAFDQRKADLFRRLASVQPLFSFLDHINGNSSSSDPFSEGMKMELPSLQYSTSHLGSWVAPCSPLPSHEAFDTLIQSPLSDRTQSNCPSPRNSGLLEALVYEPKSSRGTNDHSYHQFQDTSVIAGDGVESSSLNLSETIWDTHPISPNSHSAASAFVGSGGCTSDEPQSAEPMPGKFDVVAAESDMKNDISFPSDYLRPDAMLDSFCCKDSLITGDVGALLDDINCDFKQDSTFLLSDELNQSFGWGSSLWDYPSSARYPSLKQY